MKYIFVAGAPGSKWSSVVKNIYYSASVDQSDYRDEWTYYHDASGKTDEIQTWYRNQFVPAIRSAEAAAKFRENMMYTTPAEHSAAGVRASMARLQQTWQPIAKRIDPNK